MLEYLINHFDDYEYYIKRNYTTMAGYRITDETDLEECCAGTINEMYYELV